MTEIGFALVWLTLQVTVVLLVVGAVYACLGRATPRTRSGVLTTGLAVTVALTLLTFSPWPNWWPRPSVERVADEVAPPISSPLEDETESVADAGSVENGGDVVDPIATADELTTSTFWAYAEGFVEGLRRPGPVASEEPVSVPVWPAVVVWAFAAVTAFGMLRIALGVWSVRRLRARSRPIEDASLRELLDVVCAEVSCARTVELRESDAISPAATCGWRRPVVLLSTEWRTWSEPELRAVLAHELAHVGGGDVSSLLWFDLGVLLHFYHPLMHWLSNRARLECELAADAAAADLAGGPQPYLRVLAEMVLRESSQRTSWSVASFLPTRRTFLRRIEVLRELEDRGTGRRIGRGALAAAVTLLVGTGLVVAGLREPPPTEREGADDAVVEQVATVEAAATDAGSKAAEEETLDLAYLPRDLGFLWQLEVADVLADRRYESIVELFEEDEEKRGWRPFTVPVSLVERLTLTALPRDPVKTSATLFRGPQEPLTIVRTKKDVTPEQLQFQPSNEASFGGVRLYEFQNNVVAVPSPRVVVISSSANTVRYALAQGERGAAGAVWEADLKRVAGSQVRVFGNMVAFRGEIPEDQAANPALAMLGPLVRATNTIVVGVRMDDDISLNAYASCNSTNEAQATAKTLGAMRQLYENWITQARLGQLGRVPPAQRVQFDALLAQGEKLAKSVKLTHEGRLVHATGRLADFNAGNVVAATLVPAIRDARTAARRAQAKNNLKQIGIAMHAYHDAYGHFPPAALTGPDGKTKHSWRVALLPFLEGAALYEAYDLKQPWDSEHNKQVLAKMPAVFRDPHEPATSTNASYYALVGKGTVFDGEKGTAFRDITDGSANTVMIVSAKRKIPWTKPADIEVDLTKELPKFGGYYDDGFQTSFADGSVRTIPKTIAPNVLKVLIGKSDGQVTPEF